MNTQTAIQKLIDDRLITAAKMYAYELQAEKINMLLACATGQVFTIIQTAKIIDELNTNPQLY